MRISFTTLPENLTLANGYGYAGFKMVTSLQKLGHSVPFGDDSAPVEIAFNQPDHQTWSGTKAYRIQYTPWESTALHPGWLEGFCEADEVWTPSPLIAKWFNEAGVDRDIRVYEHGVDPIWRPRRRRASDKIRFLHHGEPAPRKGGQMALDAFRAAFGDRDDVHLTFKAHSYSAMRVRDSQGSILGLPHIMYDNVSFFNQEFDLETQLIPMYQMHDVMVYPSYGEGFGLIPLQAMATGAITICTEAWAPYSRFLLDGCKLQSVLGDSPWQELHPGKLFHPNFDHLVETYRYVYDNIDKLREQAYANSFRVHKEYDWLKLTECAFRHIVKKFEGS